MDMNENAPKPSDLEQEAVDTQASDFDFVGDGFDAMPTANAEPVQVEESAKPVADEEVKETAEKLSFEPLPEHNIDGCRDEFAPTEPDNTAKTAVAASMLTGVNTRIDGLGTISHEFPEADRFNDGEPVFSDPQDQQFATAMQMARYLNAPDGFNAELAKPGRAWSNSLSHKGKNIPVVSRAVGSSGALGAIKRHAKTGYDVVVLLPHSGIYLTYGPASEEDFCEYDINQTMLSDEIGRSTYGMMLNADSGAYIQSQVMWALEFVKSSTVNVGNADLVTTLIDLIDPRDYWRVILGPVIGRFPDGIPWSIHCTSGECQHVEVGKLHIAIAMRVDRNAFNDKQLEFLDTHVLNGSATIAEVQDYQKLNRLDDEVFEDDLGDGYYIRYYFKFGTLRDLFNYTERYQKELSRSVEDALGNRATQHERDQFLRRIRQTRYLTRYGHRIAKIEVGNTANTEPDEIETDQRRILDILIERSQADSWTAVRDAIEVFTTRNTHTILAHKARECPVCKSKHEAQIEAGAFRGLVPISPDRLFSTLCQSISMMQDMKD